MFTGGEEMKHIIVVDDDAAVVRVTLKRIELFGYNVTGTTDPVAAVDLVRDEPDKFDLMITDMVMPKLNGVELSLEVLKIRPDLPIILSSGFCPQMEATCQRVGFCKVLEKPVGMEDLIGAVQEVLKA
jgi:CheY-like chemotaxis protein